MRHHELVVDGIPLHVAEAGTGPALLLVHGLGVSHETWEPTLRTFASRWRVIAPDLPGHGRSGKPDAPYTVDFFAGVLRSLGRALGVEEAVVVGNSMGGRIALELAIHYPRFTRALVLAAPASSFPRAFGPMVALGSGLASPRLMRHVLPWAQGQCFHDPGHPARATHCALVAARLAHEDWPQHVRAILRSLVGVVAAERPALETVTQPVLIVWGRDDRLLPAPLAQPLRRAMPHARLVMLSRCGHLPMLEQPAAFHRVVDQFLREADATPRRRAAGGGI
jgi:pimeloyl-ACP methyl ester carboxylesterase